MQSTREERRDQIVRKLGTAHFASVGELASELGYSLATIKRDLVELERQGLVRRTRGGAVPVNRYQIDPPYFMKLSDMEADRDKDALARVARHLLRDNLTVIMDSSTTCLHMIPLIAQYHGIHVITNGVVTAAMLSENTNAEVCILGGVVSLRHQTINGAKAYNDMLSYSADLALLSCRGFDPVMGSSEFNEGEALIKQAMRRQATEVALLVTEDKLGERFVYQSLRCTDIDYFITDAELGEEELSQLDGSNIEVMRASEYL